MPAAARIYLDHAATSWPKSDAVVAAVTDYLRENGAPAGRGAYRESIDVDRRIGTLRRDLARIIDAPDPRHVVFAFNGTDALNLALHGFLRPGDHVVTTEAEHNSVLRPLAWLAEHRAVRVDYATFDATGRVNLDDLRRLIRKGETRLVALVHASNVTGAIQPIDEAAVLAAEAGAEFLVDAAQSLGHWPLSVRRTRISFLAAPGHKGLGGPLGTGFLYLAPGLEQLTEPLRQGGTGTRSEDDHQPFELPSRYEAGNLNVPGLVGLGAATATLTAETIESNRQHLSALTARAREGLRAIQGVTCYGPDDCAEQVGVLSLTIDGFDPQEVATTLDAAFGIQVRAGFHCAPRMHRTLGTLASGGTVRLSWGATTTPEMIDAAVSAIAELATTV